MVLPEPAAHDPPGQAVGWLDEIALTLRLSRAAVLVLIDKARPARLGDLVRTLRHDWPDIDVIADVGKLVDVPPGSTIVLVPTPQDAGWLNLRRGQFSDRKLKVVLWCDEATTLALKFHAPDFYDWIGRHKDCPSGPAPFAIHGIRKAFEQDWPVAWTGSTERAAVEEAVRAALPGEEVVWLPDSAPFEEMVEVMKAPGVVAAEALTERQLRRARWARAAAGRTFRVVLVTGDLEAPGFWPVHDRPMTLAEACERLAAAGVKAPGRVAALLDLEPEAIELAASLLRGDASQPALSSLDLARRATRIEEALDRPDPGAAVARSSLGPGEEKSWDELLSGPSPPAFRGLIGGPLLREPFKLSASLRNEHPRERPDRWVGVLAAHGHVPLWDKESEWMWILSRITLRAWGIELALRGGIERAQDELTLAWAAATLGEGDVAARWLGGARNGHLREAFRPVLPRISEEHTPETLVALLRDTVNSLNTTAERFNAGLRGEAAPWRTLSIALYLAGAASFVAILFTVAFTFHRVLPLLVSVGLLVLFTTVGTAFDNHVRYLKRGIRDGFRIPDMSTLAEGLEQHEQKQRACVQALLAEGNRAEAASVIRQLFIAENIPLSAELLFLTARLLAETGRAAEATRALMHLTATTLPAKANLRPAPEPGGADDLFLQRLLDQPAGVLADVADAHVTLVDALLKQGRYPEALIVARGAITRFAGRKEKAVSELATRAADLERRTGAVAR